ncbi:MAG: ferredoxin reductase [Acidimicrobiales bacterium]
MLRWLVSSVTKTITETPDAVSLWLDVPEWPGHQAGQHVDVRLTAEDGYSAERSYSIASSPRSDGVELSIVRLEDGEVSPYLTGLAVGDQFEVRGPIGGYFVWDKTETRPVLLLGGGSGVVPLMSMFRYHADLDAATHMRLAYSARTEQDLLYREELTKLPSGERDVFITLTREPSSTWSGLRGRIEHDLLSELTSPFSDDLLCFICGPTPFVESVANALVALRVKPGNVKTERFGPTNGG